MMASLPKRPPPREAEPEPSAPKGDRAIEALAWLAALKALGGTALVLLFALAVFAVVLAVSSVGTGQSELACAASPAASASIPPAFLQLYVEAGRAYALDWAVLAAIGYVESG